MLYRNRSEAGRVLAQRLAHYAGRDDVIVLGLPRGGLPVAYEVARAVRAPLDVFVVRKLGVPGHEEMAMGAIASGGVQVLDPDIVRSLRLTDDQIKTVAACERRELERREQAYRDGRPAPVVHGQTVLLVDDGLATGSTLRAAIRAVRRLGPARVVVGVPLGAADACRELDLEADEIVCAAMPETLHAVGLWYEDFSQTTDEEVRELLAKAALEHERGSSLARESQSPARGGPS